MKPPPRASLEKDDEIVDALWSVSCAATGLRGSKLPVHGRPIPLRQAVDLLNHDRGVHDVPLRRRALGRLRQAGLPRAGEPLAESVRHLAIKAYASDALDADLDGHDLVAAIAAHAPPGHRECIAIHAGTSRVWYDPATRATTGDVTVFVNRPLAELPLFLDPRLWKRCTVIFQQSDEVDRQTYQPKRTTPDGSAWSGYLRECFRVPIGIFENVLHIEFAIDAAEIAMHYYLYDSVHYTPPWAFTPGPGVLEVDSGFAIAEPLDGRPEWTRLRMRKTVVYRDLNPEDPGVLGIDFGQLLNYAAPALMAMWVDDATQGRLCCARDALEGAQP
jgi:hypothetical protein